jgi:hypothetical protein
LLRTPEISWLKHNWIGYRITATPSKPAITGTSRAAQPDHRKPLTRDLLAPRYPRGHFSPIRRAQSDADRHARRAMEMGS